MHCPICGNKMRIQHKQTRGNHFEDFIPIYFAAIECFQCQFSLRQQYEITSEKEEVEAEKLLKKKFKKLVKGQ